MNYNRESDENGAALHNICHGDGNPVAWMPLENAGITKDLSKETSAKPEWEGPKPIWESYQTKEFCEGIKQSLIDNPISL